MSWFDTAGLASIAKKALKEAQKQIDKALDIQDDDINSQQSKNSKETSETAPAPMQQAASPLWTEPNTRAWGSFSGSFFENSKSGEMITTPPKSGQSPINDASKRSSMQSNSDSAKSPSSISPAPSSSSITVHPSDSVEVISTPPSSDILSPPLSCKSPESIEVLTSYAAADDEDEDDSMSFSTVMNDSLINQSELTRSAGGDENRTNSLAITDSFDSAKTVIEPPEKEHPSQLSLDDALMESRTVLSDSTQSFEDIQIRDCSSGASDDKELIKISSSPPSDHNSIDEIETTTSSDIEIISNPNGDSSSTNSIYRSSPSKGGAMVMLKKSATGNECKTLKKGHCRGPSEVSLQSDDSQSEVDRLMRRISELNEMLEARELRLVEINRQNVLLQDKTMEMQALFEAKQKKTDHIESEEYTQRLSAIEKKFQMSIRERDALKIQLKAKQDELNGKIPKDDLNKIVAEKDFMITELRTEGEKLAKQVLQHSNIIKKLRAKERDADSLLKKNKEQIEGLTEEVERLKKSLTAKEEVERSQIEAVHKLCSEKRKLENENNSMRSEREDLQSKLETLQKSFEAVKTELTDRQDAHIELTRKAEILATVEKEKQKTQSQNLEVLTQLEELREKVKLAETGMTLREQQLRQENSDLLRRLEESEMRAEELTQEVSLATVPLLKQLGSLQTTLTSRTNCWDNQEKELLAKLDASQQRLKSLENIKNSSKEEISLLMSKIGNLENKLSMTLLQSEQAKESLQQAELDFSLKEVDFKRQINDLENKLRECTESINEYKHKIETLEIHSEENTTISTAVVTFKPEKNSSIPMQLNNLELASDLMRTSGNTSPTISLGHNSLAESLGSSVWQVDDLDCISNAGQQAGSSSVYGGFNLGFGASGHTASTLEHLQSALKQKDGELCQLHWELSRLQSERNVLNSEISNLTLELEQLKEKQEVRATMETELSELRRQYDAMLQMYGEKIEENEELQLDLQDVKEMYKGQIDELLRQQRNRSA